MPCRPTPSKCASHLLRHARRPVKARANAPCSSAASRSADTGAITVKQRHMDAMISTHLAMGGVWPLESRAGSLVVRTLHDPDNAQLRSNSLQQTTPASVDRSIRGHHGSDQQYRSNAIFRPSTFAEPTAAIGATGARTHSILTALRICQTRPRLSQRHDTRLASTCAAHAGPYQQDDAVIKYYSTDTLVFRHPKIEGVQACHHYQPAKVRRQSCRSALAAE